MKQKRRTRGVSNPLDGLHQLLMILSFDKDGLVSKSSRAPFSAFIDHVIKHEPWSQYLGWYDLNSLLRSEILRALSAEHRTSGGRLKELLKAGELDDLSKRIAKHLKSFPRKYELWIKLPLMPLWGVGTIELSERLSFVELENQDLPKIIQLKEPDKTPAQGQPSVYLRVSCEGYASYGQDTSANAAGFSLVKQFLQLCAPAAVIYRDIFATMFLDATRPSAFVRDKESDRINPVVLSTTLAEALSSVTIDSNKLVASGNGLLAIPVPPETRPQKVTALKNAVKKEADVINQFSTNQDAARIATALEWAFDCETTENETLAFLQACIGLEALLGDKEKFGVTDRLADRCAYLLGRVETERQTLRDEFKQVYEARSKIVHGRNSRLGVNEAEHLIVAKRLLSNTVWQEIRNLQGAITDVPGFTENPLRKALAS